MGWLAAVAKRAAVASRGLALFPKSQEEEPVHPVPTIYVFATLLLVPRGVYV